MLDPRMFYVPALERTVQQTTQINRDTARQLQDVTFHHTDEYGERSVRVERPDMVAYVSLDRRGKARARVVAANETALDAFLREVHEALPALEERAGRRVRFHDIGDGVGDGTRRRRVGLRPAPENERGDHADAQRSNCDSEQNDQRTPPSPSGFASMNDG